LRVTHRNHASASSLELDIRLAHHPAPLLHLGRHERAKLVRRVFADIDVERRQAVDDPALAQTVLRPALSLATMAAGVPVGTNTPFHS